MKREELAYKLSLIYEKIIDIEHRLEKMEIKKRRAEAEKRRNTAEMEIRECDFGDFRCYGADRGEEMAIFNSHFDEREEI